MNLPSFSSDEEMVLTCVETLKARERELSGPRDDGPSADALHHFSVEIASMFEDGPENYPVSSWFSLHGEVVHLQNSWLFPECDPVAALMVPYLGKLESDMRSTLLATFPEVAADLEKVMNLSIIARCAERVVIEQKDRKEARRRFWRKLFRLKRGPAL